MKNRRPSEIQTKALGRVAGVDAPVDNIFGVNQVLSWIAGQRSELIEDLEWRSQVPDLVGKLIQQTKQGQQSMFES